MQNYGYNPYSFDEFLQLRKDYDGFSDNVFIQKVIAFFSSEEKEQIVRELESFSRKVSDEWRVLVEEAARPENHPRIRHYDAHNHRIDLIVRSGESRILEKEVFGEALFSKKTPKWEMFSKRFFIHQNGEAGITCPIACTDGLIDLLDEFRDELSEPVAEVLQHCKEGKEGSFGIGAQFMSEIQGGSNIPANVLTAVKEGEHYCLYGNKFFCSAAHADYSVVTARIEGTNHIGVFIVPTWLPGDKERNQRNGHHINRLKWKLGTAELPSAEINYEGAVAYPIGPIERGVANAVRIVLTKSRLDIGLASAAYLMRAAREVRLYVKFREVFGRKIYEFPLALQQVNEIELAAKRTTAGAFKVFSEYLKSKAGDHADSKGLQFLVRELILMQKIVSAKEAVDYLRTSISLFGGHGVIEDFSSLPRLYRDAMVNELWEGPKNVLLAQIHRDLKNAQSWYSMEKFIDDVVGRNDQADQFATRLKVLLQKPIFMEATPENLEAAKEWEQLIESLFRCYQLSALDEIGDYPIIQSLETSVRI